MLGREIEKIVTASKVSDSPAPHLKPTSAGLMPIFLKPA
jgi:hypothetical protein